MSFPTTPGVSFFIRPHSIQTQFELTPELQAQYELKSPPREATKRDTKRVGDISEAQVITAFTKLGFHVLLPFGENHRYDLVGDADQLDAGVPCRVRSCVLSRHPPSPPPPPPADSPTPALLERLIDDASLF